MKFSRSLLISINILVIIVVLLSCSLENHQADSDGVFIPIFSATQGRGLSSYSISNLRGDVSSSSVIQTFPLLQSLKKVSLTSLEVEIENSSKETSVWGFDIRLERVNINNDGFYCLYALYDDIYKVGFVDYYYSFDTETFSLREMFLYTKSSSGSNQLTFNENYGELNILEYLDMKVTDSTQYGIEFSSEEYNEDGTLKNNIKATKINLNNHTGYSSALEGRTDGQLLNERWYYPYGYRINSIGVTAKSNNGVFSSYTDPTRKWSDGGFVVNNVAAKEWFDTFLSISNPKTIDLACIKGILPFFFEDSSDIVSYYFDKDKSFKSHDEYKRISISQFADSIASSTGVRFWSNLATNGHGPLIFDYKNLTGYSLGDRIDHYNCYSYNKENIIERFKSVIGVDTVDEVVSYLNDVLSDYQTGLIRIQNSEYLTRIAHQIPTESLTVTSFGTIVDRYSDKMRSLNLVDVPLEDYKRGVKAMSDYCGFNVNVESSGVLSQFVTEHLKYCGISNANYIENFIATVSLCDNVYTTDGVTIENPEVYLKKLVFHYLMRLIDFGR